jgi:hypothetical protein
MGEIMLEHSQKQVPRNPRVEKDPPRRTATGLPVVLGRCLRLGFGLLECFERRQLVVVVILVPRQERVGPVWRSAVTVR